MLKSPENIVVQTLVVLIPASLILNYAIHSGPLPDNDYWGVVGHFLNEQGFSRNISNWFIRSNEHQVLIPKLIYALNLLLTGGHNVGLTVYTWLAALAQVMLLMFLLPTDKKYHPVVFTISLLIISAFIFSPKNSHNWIMGMSGVAWITSNLFSLCAIFALTRFSNSRHHSYFFTCLLFTFLGILTYSTSLVLLPTLFLGTLLLKLQPRYILVIVIVNFIVLIIYYLNYTQPPGHPPLQTSATALINYILLFIGSLPTNNFNTAFTVGLLGILLSLFLAIYAHKRHKLWQQLIPFFLIQLYALGNGAMAAISRSGFGVEQALSSRYASLPALFWLSLSIILVLICNQLKNKYRQLTLTSAFLLISTILFFTHSSSRQRAHQLLVRSEKKMLSMAAIYAHAFDEKLLKETISPALPNLAMAERITRILEANQFIPFHGTFKDCPRVGQKIKPAPVQNTTAMQMPSGSMEHLRLRNNSVVEASGRIFNHTEQIYCLVITNQQHRVLGVAIHGISNPRLLSFPNDISTTYSAWQGYGNIQDHDRITEAFILTGNPKHWMPLSGRYKLTRINNKISIHKIQLN